MKKSLQRIVTQLSNAFGREMSISVVYSYLHEDYHYVIEDMSTRYSRSTIQIPASEHLSEADIIPWFYNHYPEYFI